MVFLGGQQLRVSFVFPAKMAEQALLKPTMSLYIHTYIYMVWWLRDEMDSGPRLLGFESQLCYLVAM